MGRHHKMGESIILMKRGEGREKDITYLYWSKSLVLPSGDLSLLIKILKIFTKRMKLICKNNTHRGQASSCRDPLALAAPGYTLRSTYSLALPFRSNHVHL